MILKSETKNMILYKFWNISPFWNGFKSDKIVDVSLSSASECLGNISIFVYIFEDENRHLLEEYNDKVFDNFLSNVDVVILYIFVLFPQLPMKRNSRNLVLIYE